MEIAGKLALVTGGTDGIGLWIARLLKQKGATVIAARRNYFLVGGQLAVIAITIYPADRFRHAMVLRRSRTSG